MSAAATRLDAVTADVACRFRSGQRETKLLLHRARQKPAHAVLLPVGCCIISSMLAPPVWLSSVSRRSCLVTRSTIGSSLLGGTFAAAALSDFETTDRGGFLAMTVADVTLRRDAVFDWALPFLGAALFVFRDFMERVDKVLGSFGSRRRN
jgi:hypothetical protein